MLHLREAEALTGARTHYSLYSVKPRRVILQTVTALVEILPEAGIHFAK